MEEKVIKMILYYVLAIYDEEKKTLDSCVEFNKLLIAMIQDDIENADKLLNKFPVEHPVYAIYQELKQKSKEEILTLLNYSNNKFINAKIKDDCLKCLEDDTEAEEIIKKINK